MINRVTIVVFPANPWASIPIEDTISIRILTSGGVAGGVFIHLLVFKIIRAFSFCIKIHHPTLVVVVVIKAIFIHQIIRLQSVIPILIHNPAKTRLPIAIAVLLTRGKRGTIAIVINSKKAISNVFIHKTVAVIIDSIRRLFVIIAIAVIVQTVSGSNGRLHLCKKFFHQSIGEAVVGQFLPQTDVALIAGVSRGINGVLLSH